MDLRLQILKKIEEYDTIIIHRHVIPDGDAYGSSFGLKEIITTNYPNKKVYVVGEELDHLKYLGTTDNIDDSTYKDALVIITDTSNFARISDVRWRLGAFKIKIDHHPFSDEYADIELIDTTFPSACELVVDFMVYNNLKISSEGARVLYNGMVTDTGRFLFRGVSERTFKYASMLVSQDFDMANLYSSIYTRSKAMARFTGYSVLNFKETDNGIAYLKLTDEILKDLGVSEVLASAEVNSLANIEGIKAWVFFVENRETNDIRVNLRSSGMPVNGIARKYGGGGHVQASGARVSTWNDTDLMISDLDELAKEY